MMKATADLHVFLSSCNITEKLYPYEKLELSQVPIHIKTEIEHYVVVYKIKKNKVYISDPAIGLIKEDLKSFLEKWSGVFFLVSEK